MAFNNIQKHDAKYQELTELKNYFGNIVEKARCERLAFVKKNHRYPEYINVNIYDGEKMIEYSSMVGQIDENGDMRLFGMRVLLTTNLKREEVIVSG